MPCSASSASWTAVNEGKLTLLDSKTAHWETEEANTLMTNFLTQYHDIQGVMAANDSMALGVVKALDAAGLSGKIQVVGFDNIPAVQPLIKSGKMLATVEQYGADMAVLGINYGLKEMDGETFSGWVKTPIKLIEAKDLHIVCSLEGRTASRRWARAAGPRLLRCKRRLAMAARGTCTMDNPILTLTGVGKRFPGVVALRGVRSRWRAARAMCCSARTARASRR